MGVDSVKTGSPIVDSIVDPLTKSGRVILEPHSRIHQGKSFVAGSYSEAVADNGVIDTLIKVGSNPLHIIGIPDAGGDAVAQMFEDTVVNDVVVVTDDAGTYTAGDIVVTVNGTDVTESFDTDKNTTMTALAASIQALEDVLTAVYASGAHTITITPISGGDLEISVDVSGITGTMTISSISGGTHLTIFNRNRSLTTVSNAIIKIDPDITTDGTAFPPMWFTGQNAQGDESRGLLEWYTKANSNYLFRVKNLNGDAQSLSSIIDFYIS